MKTFTLLFMMILGFTNTFSQDYYPLVSEDKQWSVLEVTENGPYPWDTVYQTLTYKFEGDTVFNNNSYLKVYRSNEEIPVNWSYNGGIREDEDKKVWSVYNSGSDENLLYDFSLNIGDTMIFDEGYVEMIVDTITLIDIGNTVRKKYHLRYYNDPDIKETWIEGIGSSLGILTSGTEGIDGGGYWLLCMTENDELIYMNPEYNSCYLISTGTKEIISHDFEVYPNPATQGYITFEFKSTEHHKNMELRCFDIYGNELHEKKVYQFQEKIMVNVSNWRNGLYMVIIYSDGVPVGYCKFVVQ